MKNAIIAILFAAGLAACSDSADESSGTSAGSSFPPLPTSSSERVTLTGKMSFWMYEGAGGCFGTIASGSQEVQLWIDADGCGDQDYAENEDASVEVTFKADNQYGPGETYTITRFL